VPPAYSLDFRRKVVDACARGDRTQHQVAEDFGIGVASVVRFVARSRRGKLACVRAASIPGRRRLDAEGEQQLLALLGANPDASGMELAADLGGMGIIVSSPR
jgi:transposase